MAAQKQETKFSAEMFGIFECLLPQNPSTFLILQDQMEDYHKIQKQEALGNFFSLKMISKLAPE